MKNTVLLFLTAMLSLFSFSSCEKESITLKDIRDVGLKVTFGQKKSMTSGSEWELSYETPQNYYVGLKSATLLGTGNTDDVILFNEPDLVSSFVFDYTDNSTVHSLLKGTEIPDGEYQGIEIEIYFLQMNLGIGTIDRGVERRNIRIYLSDDNETEGGSHQPGDMTQIEEGIETGWLLGEGLFPNMDPVTPRSAAYTEFGEGIQWISFAGKPGNEYGPFGDLNFMSEPHPIYTQIVDFNFEDQGGDELILDFNVENCWQFEDRNQDGYFGPQDLNIDPENPTRWHMELPVMTVKLQ